MHVPLITVDAYRHTISSEGYVNNMGLTYWIVAGYTHHGSQNAVTLHSFQNVLRRSLGSTVRRLSDVREDDAPVDFGMPAGDLDALLPALPEAEEPDPVQPGVALTHNFQQRSPYSSTEASHQPPG